MSRWAVVGASSFYGQAFVQQLYKAGALGVLELNRPTFDLVKSPLALQSALFEYEPDYVVNFAALNMVAPSWEHWEDYYLANIIGVARLGQYLVGKKWLKKFVQVSTPEVYGRTFERLDESASFHPTTPYSISRAAADRHLLALHATQRLPVVFTRTVNIYGPGQQTYRIIPRTALACALNFKLTLDGGGVTERAFIHVDDAARSVRDVAMRGRVGQTYHVSTFRMAKIRDIVQMVCKAAGRQFGDVVADGPERPGKDPAYWLAWDKIRTEIGWTPTVDLEAGVAETVAWYLARSDEYRGKLLDYVHKN